jgi:Leucine Rich repeat
MPHREELHAWGDLWCGDTLFRLPTLTSLRSLDLRLDDYYHLDVLAANQALGRLESLFIQPRALTEDEDSAFLSQRQLTALLRSPHLPALAHLTLRQTDLGDELCEELVVSGSLKRLRTLDLARGCITDKGAQILAACPDVRNLESLNLTCNALTSQGIEALGQAGVKVRADDQHDADDTAYLYEGDWE